MGRGFDHIDLRVRNLVEVHHFYENLLPALGFTEPVEVGAWIQFQRTGSGEATEFVGVIESPQHVPNECRTAFWAQSTDEVDRLARLIVELGARKRGGAGLFRRAGLLCGLLRGSEREPFGNLPPCRGSRMNLKEATDR
ncbi:MAG TPA: VOC family protein [Nitrospiraceae bacterium]|nr:VOC family protein [Nitrospiraceae bacterium]